jgi:hypothetical protein
MARVDKSQSPRKNGGKTGRFEPGNAGRPPGARNKTTVALESLLAGEGEALTRKAIELALGGDGVVLRACLDRILPLRRGRPVTFPLPPLGSAADLPEALNAVLAAVAEGAVTPDEGVSLAQIIETRRRALETQELEARIAALEHGAGG